MPDTQMVSNEEIKKLLEENIALMKEVKEDTIYVKKYVVMSQVLGFVKVFIVVVPIIWAAFYLPKMLGNVLAPYQELLGVTQGASIEETVKQIAPQVIKK